MVYIAFMCQLLGKGCTILEVKCKQQNNANNQVIWRKETRRKSIKIVKDELLVQTSKMEDSHQHWKITARM